MIKRTKLEIEPLKSICWSGHKIIDWASGGEKYNIKTSEKEDSSFFLGYKFDSAIMSEDGQYAIVYENLGTKGLIFKGSELIREINRSYYHAHVYEYPIEIIKLKSGKTVIIHCPNEYCQLEIEEIETGEKLGFKSERKSLDFFHSRLGASENYLISAGWAWHPYDSILMYDFKKALTDITELDGNGIQVSFGHQITSARFISETRIIVSTSTEEPEDFEGDLMRPCSIGIFDIEEKKLLKQIKLNFSFGNVIPIDMDYALDIFDYPKVINLNTGVIEEQYEDIKTGNRDSSIIYHLEELPKLAVSRDNMNIAIQVKDGVEILQIERRT